VLITAILLLIFWYVLIFKCNQTRTLRRTWSFMQVVGFGCLGEAS